jgi:O-antigen/teichoic acid export membrane protein
MFGRDSLYVLVAVVQLAAAALVTPVLARVLSERQFGTFSADVALEQALVAILSLGMVGGAQRTYFQHGKSHAQQLLLISAALITLLATAGALTSDWWGGKVGFGGSSSGLRLVIVWGALAASTQIVVYGLRAIDRLPAFALVSLLQSCVAQVLGLLLAITHRRSAGDVVLGCAIIQAISLLVAWSYFPPKLVQRVNAKVLVRVVTFSLTLMPQAIAFFFINAVDRLMILHFLGSTQVARYQLAYNLGGISVLLSTYFHQSWESRTFSIRDPKLRLALTARSRDQLFGLFILFSTATALGGPSALYIWAPKNYHTRGLILVLILLSVCAVPHSSAMARARVLMAGGHGVLMVLSTMVAAITNVGVNLVLIPRFGLNGAAVSVLISFVTMDISLWLLARKEAPLVRPGHGVLLMFVGGALTVFVAYVLPEGGEWFWIRVALGSLPLAAGARRFRSLARTPALRT